ncbi:toxin-antitoxin system YwqK family antitoxin [Streptomyces yunnanensis]|uniref:MORN repeat variant n=1 Tax=Streptomyces yunnanensis TaxID=156453 RepID=A0A9X8R0L4_9ACTN|nr:hypothetical protein [Streptomyces yunnanensis]SHN36375.1 MORN repeat variant [Streptomyces yunnanensis]
MNRVTFEEIELEGGCYALCQGVPFTGEVIDTGEGGQIESLTTYQHGLPNGPDLAWFPDGRLRSRGECRKGVAVGEWEEWHANGQLASHKEFDEHGNIRHGRWWDAEGNLIDETH